MTEELKRILEDLTSHPEKNEVDHLSLLEDIYWRYKEGEKILQPIATLYINGLDNIPHLSDRKIWNTENFEQHREPLIEAYPQLLELTSALLNEENERRGKIRRRFGREKEKLFYEYVDQVLWEDWDPIGINDAAPRDEYSGYVPKIHQLLLEGVMRNEIAEQLYRFQTEQIEIFEGKEHCDKIAIKLVDFREVNGP